MRVAEVIAARTIADAIVEFQAVRADQLCHFLRELASTISHGHGHGRTAPGTSAATRGAVRAGIPLTADEQALLLQALIDIDTPSSWPAAHVALDAIAAALGNPPAGQPGGERRRPPGHWRA